MILRGTEAQIYLATLGALNRTAYTSGLDAVAKRYIARRVVYEYRDIKEKPSKDVDDARGE